MNPPILSSLTNWAKITSMKNIQQLLGEEWVSHEILGGEAKHPLGKWHRKHPNNPVIRYVEELAGFVLDDAVRCDVSRLASKLKGEFVETLIELGYAVFLAKQGFRVVMEPTAPEAGPDLLAVKNAEYYIEIRKVGLDDVHEAVDLATEDVFRRLCSLPSRYSVLISMTAEYSAYSPQLKKAVGLIEDVMTDLAKRRVARATLYYYDSTDYAVQEGDEVQPKYNYRDPEKLARQIRDQQKVQHAPFVARFYDTGQENERTMVGVHSLGAKPHRLKPDETYLRLRSILKKKQKQLPKDSAGLIMLEITDLEKLMVDEVTLSAALYGDLVMNLRAEPGFPHDLYRKPNGFFMGTSRVSAVVIERCRVSDDDVLVTREVFPTNNPHAKVLTLGELECFGEVAGGYEHLCAEQLRDSSL